MQRISLEPSFILHTRPYSNSSLIADIFSVQHGRLSVLARSARGPQSRFRGQLQLFEPLLLSWAGRGELKNLSEAERNGSALPLQGQALLCGFYVNELLQRLLQREDPHPALFADYHTALQQLVDQKTILRTLRIFEKRLLEHLGYALPLEREVRSGKSIEASVCYQYIPDYGFVGCTPQEGDLNIFSGSTLLALQQEQFETEQALQEAKRLMRLALARHLGNRPLKSRELMI